MIERVTVALARPTTLKDGLTGAKLYQAVGQGSSSVLIINECGGGNNLTLMFFLGLRSKPAIFYIVSF